VGHPEATAVARNHFLELLRGFGHNAREALRVNWPAWPPDWLVRLTRALFAAYPPELHPAEDGPGLVLPQHEFRLLRWRILEHLARSPGAEAATAAEEVKGIHPQAREYVESLQASRAANELLTAPSQSGQGITVVEACRFLDDRFFRLIRSADDLLEVTLEELRELEKDVGYDHAMLYCPGATGAAERHRREEAAPWRSPLRWSGHQPVVLGFLRCECAGSSAGPGCGWRWRASGRSSRGWRSISGMRRARGLEAAER
jgi:hypothetical protein